MQREHLTKFDTLMMSTHDKPKAEGNHLNTIKAIDKEPPITLYSMVKY